MCSFSKMQRDMQSPLQTEHPCKNLDGLPNSSFKEKKIINKNQAKSKQLNLQSQKKKRNTDIQIHPVYPATEVSSREMLMTNYCPKELSSAPSYLNLATAATTACITGKTYEDISTQFRHSLPPLSAKIMRCDQKDSDMRCAENKLLIRSSGNTVR